MVLEKKIKESKFCLENEINFLNLDKNTLTNKMIYSGKWHDKIDYEGQVNW